MIPGTSLSAWRCCDTTQLQFKFQFYSTVIILASAVVISRSSSKLLIINRNIPTLDYFTNKHTVISIRTNSSTVPSTYVAKVQHSRLEAVL